MDRTLSAAVALDRLDKKASAEDKSKIVSQLNEHVAALDIKLSTALIDARSPKEPAAFEYGKVDETARRYLMAYLEGKPMV